MKYFKILVALLFAIALAYIYNEQQKIIENLRLQNKLNEVQTMINESQEELNESTYIAVQKLYLKR